MVWGFLLDDFGFDFFDVDTLLLLDDFAVDFFDVDLLLDFPLDLVWLFASFSVDFLDFLSFFLLSEDSFFELEFVDFVSSFFSEDSFLELDKLLPLAFVDFLLLSDFFDPFEAFESSSLCCLFRFLLACDSNVRLRFGPSPPSSTATAALFPGHDFDRALRRRT